jgi:hypothetical protein
MVLLWPGLMPVWHVCNVCGGRGEGRGKGAVAERTRKGRSEREEIERKTGQGKIWNQVVRELGVVCAGAAWACI